jgi:hypothetical protein
MLKPPKKTTHFRNQSDLRSNQIQPIHWVPWAIAIQATATGGAAGTQLRHGEAGASDG